jgi:hypothetical protein
MEPTNDTPHRQKQVFLRRRRWTTVALASPVEPRTPKMARPYALGVDPLCGATHSGGPKDDMISSTTPAEIGHVVNFYL